MFRINVGSSYSELVFAKVKVKAFIGYWLNIGSGMTPSLKVARLESVAMKTSSSSTVVRDKDY